MTKQYTFRLSCKPGTFPDFEPNDVRKAAREMLAACRFPPATRISVESQTPPESGNVRCQVPNQCPGPNDGTAFVCVGLRNSISAYQHFGQSAFRISC
jgi:hypothetical protein